MAAQERARAVVVARFAGPKVSDLLVVSVTVAGHELQDPANGYEVISYGAGPSQVSRQTVESDDVPGRVLLAWKEDTRLGHVAVRVQAADAATLKTRFDTLVGWFRTTEYTLVATLASTLAVGNWVESWTCEPADYEEDNGGVIRPELLYNLRREVSFSWPHDPIAAA